MARLVPRSGHCELDGIRLEVNHVPGKGFFAEPAVS